MSISKFWKTYPPFCETKNFKTWQPCSVICHFCLSEVVESVLVPKNPSSRIFTSFRLLVHNLRLFQGFFRKKNSTSARYFSFGFLQSPFHEKSISSYSFQDIGVRFSAFYSQLNCLHGIKIWNRILNFCLKNFYSPSKSKKKNFEKNI